MADASPMTQCDRCGSAEFRDVDIHGNYSVRRQCRLCGRFMGWPRWRGLDLTAPETKAERCQRLLAGNPKLKTAARLFDEQAYREASARATRGQAAPINGVGNGEER